MVQDHRYCVWMRSWLGQASYVGRVVSQLRGRLNEACGPSVLCGDRARRAGSCLGGRPTSRSGPSRDPTRTWWLPRSAPFRSCCTMS